MGYIVGGKFYKQYVSTISGYAYNLDSLPTGVLVHNGVDDYSVKIWTTSIDIGRYTVSGSFPSTYQIGDSVTLCVSGYMQGNLVKADFDLGVLDTSFVGNATVSVSGNPSVNVVYFSGVPVAAANLSGAILTDLRYIGGLPTSPYQGLAQSGGTNWLQLNSTEPAVDNFYKDQILYIGGGIGARQFGLVQSYSGVNKTCYMYNNWYVTPYSGCQYSFNGYGYVDIGVVNNTQLQTPAGFNFNNFFANSGNYTRQIVDYISNPTGVRSTNVVSISPGLTISVTGNVPTVGQVLTPVSATGVTAIASVTGVVQANIVSANPGVAVSVTGTVQGITVNVFGTVTGIAPGVTVSVTGNVPTVGQVLIPVSITGANIWTASDINQMRFKIGIDGLASMPTGQYLGQLELSASGLRKIMVENNVNAHQWMSLMGAVLAGSSIANGNNITYYAMNNNGVQRIQSNAVSGTRNSIVLFLP